MADANEQSPIAGQMWDLLNGIDRHIAATQTDADKLRALMQVYDPDAHWIYPRGIATLYSDTTEDDIRHAVADRIRAMGEGGKLLITGAIWQSEHTRPPLRPDLLASIDQVGAAKGHRVIRSTRQAAQFLGVPQSTLVAAAMTKALRDDNGDPIDLLLDASHDFLWRTEDIAQLARMIDDGTLACHMANAVDGGFEFGVDDI